MVDTNKQRVISQDEADAFLADGALVLRNVVEPHWLRELELAIERDMETPGPFFHGYDAPEGGRFHGNLRIWQNDPSFERFCLDSSLPALAQQLLQTSKLNLLYDQLFVKEPKTVNRTRWHNDQPYWPIRGQQVLSFWVALDSTTLNSGALEFIAGSHRWDRWFQPETLGITEALGVYERNPDYEDIPDIEAHREDYQIISWDLEPGDVYVFHGLTVHGSPGNSTQTRRRRGYAVRYVGDDVSYDDRPGVSKPLLNSELSTGGPLDSAQYPVIAF